MKITLRFFGPLKELTQRQEQELQVKTNLNIEMLQKIIRERYPNIQEHLNSVSYSINNEYVNKSALVSEGDIVGLLPPISGG